MPKNAKPSTGTTVNPVPPPAAPPAPPAPAPAVTRKQPTAGPLPVAAASDAPDYESAFTTDLTSLIGSDEPTAPPAPALREPRVKARTTDKTPVEDEADAEGSATHTDEEAADAEPTTGEPTLEDDSPEPEAAVREAAAEDEAEDADEEGDDKRNWPGSYRRRIKKLTEKVEKFEALQAENEDLRAKIEAKESPAPGPVAGAVTSVEAKLEGEIAPLRKAISFLTKNPDGVTVNGKDGLPVELTAAQVDDLREQYQDQLDDKRLELREQRKLRESHAAQAEQVLPQRHPWMKDKTNPAAQAVENALRQYPALRAVPFAKVWLADAISYDALLRQQQKPAANGPARPARPARPPSTRPPRSGSPRRRPRRPEWPADGCPGVRESLLRECEFPAGR